MTIGTSPVEVDPDPLEPFMIGQGHGVSDLIFLSGQASIDAHGNIVGEGDIDAQIDQAMANIQCALTAAGSDVNRIFKITIYLTDMGHFERIMAMRERYFQKPWPADTTVEVASLVLPELMVELDVIATRA